MVRFAENTARRGGAFPDFSYARTGTVRRLHRMAPGYAETPLYGLDALAARLGVRAVLVKDESPRFHLKAFKGLGGIYAMYRILCRELSLDPDEATLDALLRPPYAQRVRGMAFATTTDGNHGKGVSWAAGIFGCEAHVFMPRGSVEVRAQAIRDAGGAEVTITDMRYDDCVAWTRDAARSRGWHLIQDTSWPGYEQVPLWIMQGYTTLFFEAVAQMRALGHARPTHILLQAGVGSMAGAVAAAAMEAFPDAPPVIAVVDPDAAACFYESFAAADGRAHEAGGSGETIMAGLNCAVPCSLAWDILSACAAGGFACGDEVTRRGMRLLGRPEGGDAPVVSGESGAVTAGLLERLMTDPACAGMRRALGLGGDSVVLLISTESDTDPENYKRVLAD